MSRIWTNLILFDPVWSYLIHFDPNLIQSDQLDSIRSNLIQFDMAEFDTNRSYFIQFDAIWSILIQFGPFWSNFFHLIKVEPIQINFNQFDTFWFNLIRYNSILKSVTVKKIPDTVVRHFCVWYRFNCNGLYLVQLRPILIPFDPMRSNLILFNPFWSFRQQGQRKSRSLPMTKIRRTKLMTILRTTWNFTNQSI